MRKLVVFIVLMAIVLVIFIAIFSGGESAAMFNKPFLYDSDYLKEIKKHEADELTRYKLIDSVRNIYSIPIDSAIIIYVNENK